MAEVRLAAEPGRVAGTRVSRRLRNTGKVPAVVYGHGMDPVAVTVDGRELRAALSTGAGLNALLSLDLGGQPRLALAREVQRHPVRGTVEHVDFLVVERGESVTTEVAVHLVGEATAVTSGDGVVDQALFTMAVSAPADRIPAAIEVDVSDLQVGGSIRVGDVRLPAGVTTQLDPDEPVVVGAGSSLSAEAAEIEAGDTAVAEAQSAQAEVAEAGGGEAPAAPPEPADEFAGEPGDERS